MAGPWNNLGPTPGERLPSRRDREEAAARAAGRLPESGTAMRDMRLERDRDYPADSSLCFERGGAGFTIRLTDADLHVLRAMLAVRGDLAALRSKASKLAFSDLGTADLEPVLVQLAEEAHAAGYRLADDDHRLTYQDEAGVREFLQDRLAQARENEQLADGEIGPGPEVRALERVIAMLGEK
jgi:hypothetical protein